MPRTSADRGSSVNIVELDSSVPGHARITRQELGPKMDFLKPKSNWS